MEKPAGRGSGPPLAGGGLVQHHLEQVPGQGGEDLLPVPHHPELPAEHQALHGHLPHLSLGDGLGGHLAGEDRPSPAAAAWSRAVLLTDSHRGRGVRPAASITRSNSSRVPLPFSRRRRGCRTKASGVRAVPGGTGPWGAARTARWSSW